MPPPEDTDQEIELMRRTIMSALNITEEQMGAARSRMLSEVSDNIHRQSEEVVARVIEDEAQNRERVENEPSHGPIRQAAEETERRPFGGPNLTSALVRVESLARLISGPFLTEMLPVYDSFDEDEPEWPEWCVVGAIVYDDRRNPFEVKKVGDVVELHSVEFDGDVLKVVDTLRSPEELERYSLSLPKTRWDRLVEG